MFVDVVVRELAAVEYPELARARGVRLGGAADASQRLVAEASAHMQARSSGELMARRGYSS
jgi:hypothetical protein